MAIGKRLQEVATQSQADPAHNLVNLLLETLSLLVWFNVGDYISWLAWMDLQGCVRKSKAISVKLQKVWQEVIDARRSLLRHSMSGTAIQEVDFLDVLLSAAERDDARISDSDIQAVLSDMYGAGIDTSTISIEWALCELLRHPLIMKRVQEELKAIVELHLHTASQSCQVSGFDIPPNSHVYINVWAIGRDPNVWDKPLEFCPERFLDSNIDVHGQHFELLPFGSGRRSCPAMTLGLSNVHIMLANLIHVFDWTVEDKLSLSEKFGLVLTIADPITAKASLRVPKHLLEAPLI
ncbi:hypothetical protein L7F22_066850 [Adiantum nelumboides]|nr:hypothetical protein [Adiantum nelumboides]